MGGVSSKKLQTMDFFLTFLLLFTSQVLFTSGDGEISADTRTDNQPYICGNVDETDTEYGEDYSYTTLIENENRFWKKNEAISWSFVSIGNESFLQDANIDLSKVDVQTVRAALKHIEEKTCIRFKHLKSPPKDKPRILIHRMGKHDDNSCQLSYAKQKFVGKDIAGLGDIFDHLTDKTNGEVCFRGAQASIGSASPAFLLISQMNPNPSRPNHVGLLVHELLHNLGLGHTQKRQDANDHIEIKEENIQKLKFHNYKACTVENDRNCKSYNTYGTPYDCSSIMHYGDTLFLTEEARARNAKTMVARNPST